MGNLWPHQLRGIEAFRSATRRGGRRVAITTPTGGGKTRMLCSLIEEDGRCGIPWSVYTNRRALVDQLSGVLETAGTPHGVRAAGHKDEREKLVQISSIQTEYERCYKRPEHKRWQLHRASVAAIDECHLHTGRVAREIMQSHLEAGAVILGLTATPVGLGDCYDELIVAGTNSELRQCGALVMAHHYGPDEPDLKGIGRVELGKDLTEEQCRKAIMRQGIFGRVIASYRRLNPEEKPAILFAPGVEESVWFAEKFREAGIEAAHIDGEDVWFEGRWRRTGKSIREDVLHASREGRVRVVCNRFVLREGIDAPWLEHGIFATVFGALQTYLQSGGRLLRVCAGKTRAIIQDHGGNWWRHGSLNSTRGWVLGDTSGVVAGLRDNALRYNLCPNCRTAALRFSSSCAACGSPLEREPYRCPKCDRILNSRFCPCGHEIPPGKRSRAVIQSDGVLTEHFGDVFKPRVVKRLPTTESKWRGMYYRARNSKKGMTFRQAVGLFAVEERYWPPLDLPLMPKGERDWFLLVSQVPPERLR